MMGAHLIALVALIPVVMFSRPRVTLIKNTAITLIVSTVIAIIVLILSNNDSLTLNHLINGFIWVALVNCFPPAALLMLLRSLIDAFYTGKANNGF